MTLNPFELLGVTVNATSRQVRKRYYELACLAHPDRGGTSDQMITLHAAYRFVSAQVEAINWTKTVEDCEAEFEAFSQKLKDDQKETVASMYDITAEAFDLPKFNDAVFSESNVIDGPFPKGGYSTIASDLGTEYTPAVTRDVLPMYEGSIVQYVEPVALPNHTHVKDLTHDGPLSDFSCDVADLHPCDYRIAMSEAPVLTDVIKCRIPDLDEMQEMVAARQAIYGKACVQDREMHIAPPLHVLSTGTGA